MIPWILGAPFLVLTAYAVFSAFKYTRLISHIFMGLVYKPSGSPVAFSGAEKISILDSSDQEIEALVAVKNDPKKLAIFCHESGADKESWEKYCSFLPAWGYRVLSIDFTEKRPENETDSLGQWPGLKDVERLLTVVRWAKKEYHPETPLVLFGVSKGANIALAASFYSSIPCVVVADGLFSMKEIFRDYIRKWAPILVKPNLFGQTYPDWVVNIFTELGYWHCERRSGKKFIDIEKMLRKKHAPLLMIHGEKDDYVPLSHQKFLWNMPDSRGTHHWAAPLAGHNEAVSVMRDVYEKRVKDFLTGALLVVLLMVSSVAQALEASEIDFLGTTPERARLALAIKQGIRSYASVHDYEALFQKQESVGPQETIFLKFEKPFKIFMGWMNTSKKGLQVLYERGRHDGKLVIHKPGLLLGLAPVIFLDQHSPWVREGSASYNIEDAGIGTFLNDFAQATMKGARENKLEVKASADTDGGQTMDVRFPGSRENSGFFAYHVVVHFDGRTGLPDRMRLFDWQGKPTGVYAYENLRLNIGAQDFEFKQLALSKLYQLYRPAETPAPVKNNFSGKNPPATPKAG